jgi:hypothetical protein
MKGAKRFVVLAVAGAAAASACANILGLDEELPSSPVLQYRVSGSITTKRSDGATGPAGLALKLNNEKIFVAASGPSFEFPQLLASGAAYTVAVQTHAQGEYCAVTQGTGTVTNANVSNVLVACAPAESCKEIKQRDPNARDGAYELTTKAGMVHKAYCDMTNKDGGWTLALKADGSRQTFAYGAPLWTTDQTLNEAAVGLEQTEAKYKAFNETPFTEVRLQFVTNGELRELSFSIADVSPKPLGRSLKALFATTEFQATRASRAAWLNLVPGNNNLQENCNREGVNTSASVMAPASPPPTMSVRLGIIGNGEIDCITPDSCLGLGTDVKAIACGNVDGGASAGSVGCSDSGKRDDIASFAYLFIR